MPGRLFLTSSLDHVCKALAVVPGALSELESRRNIAPGQEIAVAQDGRLSMMRWGIVPVGRKNARGRPVMETIINARSETVFEKSAFAGVARAIVPADGWYEWTGAARRKTPWAIRPKDGGMLAFAAITDVWNGPGGVALPQVATLTVEPNADVRDIHHRMGAILEPDDFDTWLNGSEAQAHGLLRPLPDGTLIIEEAVGVDWNGP